LKSDGFGELFGGTAGAVLLDEVEENTCEDDGVDDDEAGCVAGESGEDAGYQQYEYEWISEVGEKLEEDCTALPAADHVGSELSEAGGGFGGGETRHVNAEPEGRGWGERKISRTFS